MIPTIHKIRLTPRDRYKKDILNRILILRIKSMTGDNNRENYLQTVKQRKEYIKNNRSECREFDKMRKNLGNFQPDLKSLKYVRIENTPAPLMPHSNPFPSDNWGKYMNRKHKKDADRDVEIIRSTERYADVFYNPHNNVNKYCVCFGCSEEENPITVGRELKKIGTTIPSGNILPIPNTNPFETETWVMMHGTRSLDNAEKTAKKIRDTGRYANVFYDFHVKVNKYRVCYGCTRKEATQIMKGKKIV